MDYTPANDSIIRCDLAQGIPLPDESCDVVYHAHVLEHFAKGDGRKFMTECFRVLKKGGIMRVAVPDLEGIVREYIQNLDLAILGNPEAKNNYDWIMLEMYDQTIRTHSGGEMAEYLYKEELPNEEYIYKRVGNEARNIRKTFLESKKEIVSENKQKPKKTNTIKSLLHDLKYKIKNRISPQSKLPDGINEKDVAIMRFRKQGEIHQWMYDRFSLGKLMDEIGLKEICVMDAFTSNIKDWNRYQLETKDGIIYKPDSLFMEGRK